MQENNNPQITTPQEKKKQQKVGLIIFGVVFTIAVLAFALSDMGGKTTKQEDNSKTKEEDYAITISDPTKNTKTEDRWLVTAQDTMDKQSSKINETFEENAKLKAEIEKLQNEKNLQNEKFANLESQIEIISSKLSENANVRTQNDSYEREITPPKPTITKVSLDDTQDESENTSETQQTFNTKEGYIPQGSYVSAKIISSVDASVGVSAQSNPKPVLLRITGNAKSAIFNGKKLSVDITGCLITAGAIGELSSEKVYIKLSKMTCAKDGDQATEVPVQGYVTAKGSNGVRGEVIMKEGDLIAKSFLSGMVGSVGQAYSMSLAPPLTFGGGTTTQTAISGEDALKRGIGGGLGASGNQISSYLIKRAEQYQPIISIPSGIDVEIVFLEGFFLDGRNKTKNIKKVTNEKTDEKSEEQQ